MARGKLVVCDSKCCGRCQHRGVHEWRAPCDKSCSFTEQACRPATDPEAVLYTLVKAQEDRQ